MPRWSIFIDVEGFSNIYSKSDAEALRLLGNLMLYIWKVGSQVYSNETERLFIHQYGDGFLIVSNYHESSLDRPLGIAIFLMQMMIMQGGVARTGISEGDFGDVTGCYPKEIQDELTEHRGLRVGNGIMNIQKVMGATLIHSNRVQDKVDKKGPLLLLEGNLSGRFSNENLEIVHSSDQFIEINWIKSDPTILNYIYEQLNIEKPTLKVLTNNLNQYIEKYSLSGDWRDNTRNLI